MGKGVCGWKIIYPLGKIPNKHKKKVNLLRLGPGRAETKFGEVAGSFLVAGDQFLLGDIVLVLEQWVLQLLEHLLTHGV